MRPLELCCCFSRRQARRLIPSPITPTPAFTLPTPTLPHPCLFVFCCVCLPPGAVKGLLVTVIVAISNATRALAAKRDGRGVLWLCA